MSHREASVFSVAKEFGAQRLRLVLDVGTGTGTAAALACRRGAKVTAVDAGPGMVAQAALAAPEADVRLAALPHLPFADDEFDATVGNFVLNHAGQPRQALTELRRVTLLAVA